MKEREKILLTDNCVDLMLYCFNNHCSGFSLDIKTPKGIAHCNFDFTVDIKEEGDK